VGHQWDISVVRVPERPGGLPAGQGFGGFPVPGPRGARPVRSTARPRGPKSASEGSRAASACFGRVRRGRRARGSVRCRWWCPALWRSKT